MNIPNLKIENFAVLPKQEASEVMKQIWLDVQGERMLATNGHMAARVTVSVNSDDVTGLIPIEAFELARKELKVISKILGKDTIPDPQLKVTAGEDAVVIENLLTTTTHIVKRRRLLDGEKFPCIDAVFPNLKSGPTVSLDSGYVADVVKSLDGYAMSLWSSSPDKAVVMASESGDAIVVLMPIKSDPDMAKINRRGMAKNAATDESTVSIGIPDETGKMQYTEPIPHAEFIARCDEITNQ